MENDTNLALQRKAAKNAWIDNVLYHGEPNHNSYYSHADLQHYRDYLGSMYDQYKDTDRWSEIESITNSFNPGLRTTWDGFTESLGFGSSHRQNYINGMNQMMAALGQISSTNREENYNSASAAADRMRAAGLNPDLQGVEGAGQASEFSEPESVPMEGINGMDGFGNFVGSIASVFSTAVGLAKSFKDMKSQSEDIKGKQLDNDEKRNKVAEDIVFNLNKGEGEVVGDSGKSDGVPGHIDLDSLKSILDQRARNLHFSRSERKRFVQHGVDAFYSLKGQTQRYNAYSDREHSRLNAGKISGEIQSYGETSLDNFDTLAATAKYSYEMERLKINSFNKYQIKKAQYDTRVIHGMDDTLESAANNNTNAAKSVAAQSYLETEPDERGSRRAKFKVTKKASEITLAYLDHLKRNADAGDPIASFMLMQIAASSVGTNPTGDALGAIMDIAGLIK